jgi:hypothetical protein
MRSGAKPLGQEARSRNLEQRDLGRRGAAQLFAELSDGSILATMNHSGRPLIVRLDRDAIVRPEPPSRPRPR